MHVGKVMLKGMRKQAANIPFSVKACSIMLAKPPCMRESRHFSRGHAAGKASEPRAACYVSTNRMQPASSCMRHSSEGLGFKP